MTTPPLTGSIEFTTDPNVDPVVKAEIPMKTNAKNNSKNIIEANKTCTIWNFEEPI